jgi:predicted ribosomally synthesized peptide with SipW-like signal peptide
MNKPRSVAGRLTATVAVLLAFAGFVGVGTLAVFNDRETVAGNTFTTGDVDISTAPATAVFTVPNMAPGDTVTPPAGIVVTNAGSLDMRYAITSVATNPTLASQLTLSVNEADTSGPGPAACDDFSGAPIYSGELDSGIGGLIVGDPAQGVQSDERSLAPGANETLCFRVHLPLSTDNTFQNMTTTATFTFDAEQTANNP